MEIGPEAVVSAIVVAIPAIGATAAIVDKRRKDLTDLWKGLYEAQKVANEEQEAKIVRLEARVNLFESNFIHEVAAGVAGAIKDLLEDNNASN